MWRNRAITIYDVAMYFLKSANSRNEPLSHLKLQKLCYYAQAWQLAFFGEPMFDDEFEAWVHGPVNYKLYLDYKKFGWSPIKEDTKGFQEDSIFDDNQLHVLDQVWKKYGRLNVKVLEALTHGEDPWKIARMLLKNDPYSLAIIVKDDMMSFYRGKIKEESGMENVKYREVNRAAKVGEKIRAVDARPMWTPHYENGDEFEVVKTRTYGILGRRIGGEDGRLCNLCDSEYVVFEPIDESEEPDEISDIKNEMERLTGELATLALRVSKLEEPESPQEIRDEIVEKVKADIEGHAINDYDHVDYIRRFTGSNQGPFYRIGNRGTALLAEYIVNRKKKTVVCLLRGIVTKTIYARGIAKCAPGDVFNSHIGRAIALRRALGLKVPAEYLSVPNPTEVREGDIVIRYDWINTMHPYHIFQIGTKPNLDSIDDYCDVIDDSREEGALDAYLA
ncbi:type II toxin-antitoxin system antitoxin SocA domain-containing protein [Paenibacillus larvae]